MNFSYLIEKLVHLATEIAHVASCDYVSLIDLVARKQYKSISFITNTILRRDGPADAWCTLCVPHVLQFHHVCMYVCVTHIESVMLSYGIFVNCLIYWL